MDNQLRPRNAAAGGSLFGLMTIIIVVAGLVAIYFLYSYLYSPKTLNLVQLIPGKVSASAAYNQLPKIPPIFEGGEYSINTWMYINSFNKNMGQRKHIFELQGTNYSTMVMGLGAHKNSLFVRVHSRDLGNTNGEALAKSGTSDSVPALFATLTDAQDSVTPPPMCDLPEVDLQRWSMVTVVLSGRTIDVYLDGKLARSCILPSYYKVDPTGVKAVMTERGGFDGYLATTSAANYALNPDEVYRMYLAGPEGTSSDVLKWLGSFFGA